MATIKSFTDISQSKKLAKILPIESADMCYRDYNGGIINGYGDCILSKSFITGQNNIRSNDLPCWSLAALLEQLPYEVVDNEGGSMYLSMNKDDDMYQLVYSDRYEDYDSIETNSYENFVDACCEMILKLHELKML